MLRIAFLVEMLKEDWDGVGITMHEIIKRLPKDKVEAIFVTPMPPDRDIGFPVYQCPYINIPVSNKGYRYGMPGRMKELKGILDDFKPHIIHFSSPSSLANYAARYARANNVKLTSIFHTHFQSYFPYYFWWLPYSYQVLNVPAYWCLWAYRQCDRIYAPTPTIKEYLMTKTMTDEQVKVWGRGVNPQKFNPGYRVADYWKDLPANSKKVLFVSRLVDEKEISTLMRVYKLFDQRRPDVKLVIVGDGPSMEKMQRKMPNAVFMGKQTGEELAKSYASADVFIFPSITETFGNVILEAMASGLPIVAAAGGGPIDIIKSGETGVLVTPKKEEEFFAETVKLLDNKEYYEKVRNNALEYARAQKWDDLVRQLVDSYRELAGLPQLAKPMSELSVAPNGKLTAGEEIEVLTQLQHKPSL